jgi:hypothetical protein
VKKVLVELRYRNRARNDASLEMNFTRISAAVDVTG